MKKYILGIITLFISITINAQEQQQIVSNTSKDSLNMEAVHLRPLNSIGHSAFSIGGYAETHWQHYHTEGITEGHELKFPRMTLFFSSQIYKSIKFMSEIEFEEGGKEVAIEFAAIDLEFLPLLNFRGGIIMNPIGAFNQNHDGPKWEFSERPIAMNSMLPATWSTVGFGLFGKYGKNPWVGSYEIYVSTGFDESIIDNTEGKTYLPASKNNTLRFDKTTNGMPTITTKTSIKHRKIGELGLSFMSGYYNNTKDDGEDIDIGRKINIAAIDFNTQFNFGTSITTEFAYIFLDLPNHYTPMYGGQQIGGFIDIVHPIYKGKIFKWEESIINIAIRGEYIDWNFGKMPTFNNTIKGDEYYSIMTGISFRPISKTVIRASYRYAGNIDFLRNPTEFTTGFTLGISSYF